MKTYKILLLSSLFLFLLIIFPINAKASILPEGTTCIFGCDDLGTEEAIETVYCENLYSEGGNNYYKYQDTIWNIQEITQWTIKQAKINKNVEYIHKNYKKVESSYKTASADKLKSLYNTLVMVDAKMMELETNKDFPCYFFETTETKGYKGETNIAKSQVANLKQKVSDKYQENNSWGCDALFGANYLKNSKTYQEIVKIVNIIKIIIPALLILYGTFDFAKATISSDTEEMKKCQVKFIKRVCIGVAIFFIPTLINVIIGLMSNGISVCQLENF